jgi:transposase
MDDLSAHRSENACASIRQEQAGCLLLLAYRPDLNPIEKRWRKVGQILRGIKARTHEELFAGIKKAQNLVFASDAQG